MVMEEIQASINNQIQALENPTHVTLQLSSETEELINPTEPEEE